MDVAILIIVIISIVVTITINLIIYMFLRNKFQAIDTIRDSAGKLDGTVTTIVTLSDNLFKQIAGLTDLQSELKFKEFNFDFKKINVILGPNNSGKSNILRLL